MRVIIAAVLLPLVAADASAQQQPAAYALTGATIIDGTGVPPIPNGVIVVEGGRIRCVGVAGECDTADLATHDMRGRWIMPGIIDAHVHYSQTGWADGRPDALDMRERFPYDATIAERRAQPEDYFRSYLCSGVTATYDVGGFPWTWSLRAPAERDPNAPHVAAAGPLLSTRDHWLNTPAERQFIHIGSDSATTRGAAYLIASGTDAIKVWFLAGADSEDADEMAARLRTIGEMARSAGVPLIVHATGLWEATLAVEAGAHLLVHGVDDQPLDERFIAAARAANTIYTPTLVVMDGYRQLSARAFDDDAYGAGMRCVDPATRAKAFLTNELPGAASAERQERMRAYMQQSAEIQADNVRRAHGAGIPIVMGTDAGNPLTLHGPSVYLEMEALQEAGLSPMDVIVASTRNGARAMRRDDIGTIEAGNIADLVILGADPLVDVRNVRRVERVVRGGVVHERAALEYPER